MRSAALAALFIIVVLFGEGRTAPARLVGSYWYPWCAIYYRLGSNGTPSCYFDTRQQCMDTISGVGGRCVGNLVPPPPRAEVTKVHKRKSTHSHAAL